MISLNNPNDTTSGFRTGNSFPSASKPSDSSRTDETINKWYDRVSNTIKFVTADNAYDRLVAGYDLASDLFWSSVTEKYTKYFRSSGSSGTPPDYPGDFDNSGRPSRDDDEVPNYRKGPKQDRSKPNKGDENMGKSYRNKNDKGGDSGKPTKVSRVGRPDSRNLKFENQSAGVTNRDSVKVSWLDPNLTTGCIPDPLNPSSETHSVLNISGGALFPGQRTGKHDQNINDFQSSLLFEVLSTDIFPLIIQQAQLALKPSTYDRMLTVENLTIYFHHVLYGIEEYYTYESITTCASNPDVQNMGIRSLSYKLDSRVAHIMSRYRESIAFHAIPPHIVQLIRVWYQNYTWNDTPDSPVFRFSHNKRHTAFGRTRWESGLNLYNNIQNINCMSPDSTLNKLMSEVQHALVFTFPQWKIGELPKSSNVPLFAPAMKEAWTNQNSFTSKWVSDTSYVNHPTIVLSSNNQTADVDYRIIGKEADPIAYAASSIMVKLPYDAQNPDDVQKYANYTGLWNPYFYDGDPFIKSEEYKYTNLSRFSNEENPIGEMEPLHRGSNAIASNIATVPFYSAGWNIFNGGSMEFKMAQSHNIQTLKHIVYGMSRWLFDPKSSK